MLSDNLLRQIGAKAMVMRKSNWIDFAEHICTETNPANPKVLLNLILAPA